MEQRTTATIFVLEAKPTPAMLAQMVYEDQQFTAIKHNVWVAPAAKLSDQEIYFWIILANAQDKYVLGLMKADVDMADAVHAVVTAWHAPVATTIGLQEIGQQVGIEAVPKLNGYLSHLQTTNLGHWETFYPEDA